MNAVFQPGKLTYFDGGMGTTLQAMGLKGGEQPERWNLTHPQQVKSVHAAYLEAGAEIVAANTFGANALHFPEDWETVLRAGVRLAKEACAEAGRGLAALDAGSLGRLLQPNGDLPFEEAVSLYRQMARAGVDAGCDLLLIETMTDLREIKAAVLGFREALETAGVSLPLCVSMSFDLRGRLLTGADIEGAAAMLSAMEGVSALGLNCGHKPQALLDNLKRLLACAGGLPVFFMPNADLPQMVEGRTVFPSTPEDFAQGMAEAVALGVNGIGGCCGTTPEYIRCLRARFGTARGKLTDESAAGEAASSAVDASGAADLGGVEPCVISGRSGTVVLGPRLVSIGERLNPTGKKRMKQALRENDIDYLLGEGVAQIDAGADALDVNAGLPEIDEAAMLPRIVEALQGVIDAPLQIDTADPAALEAALRCYVGKALINSVSGKAESMAAVFPLARRYGAAVVALLLDEQGIPETVEGRLDIARRIIAEAARQGIPKRELIFDALTLTVSTDPQAARLTLETVRRLRDELGVKTVLGVSNVSFGLPRRPVLTAAFLPMAMYCGLSAAILNPLDEGVRLSVDAARALLAQDEGFADYLGRYGGGDGAAVAGGASGAGASGAASADTAALRAALSDAHQALARVGAALGIGGIGTSAAGSSAGNIGAIGASAVGGAQGAAFVGGTMGASAASGGAGSIGASGADAVGGAQGAASVGTGSAIPPCAAALQTAIRKGLVRDASAAASAWLAEGAEGLAVIEGGVMPALNEVGALYESGRFFLPQLLQSANAAQAAFAVIREAMPAREDSAGPKVILATVRGDVHDIGKNIVKVLLQNYGFSVVDLGRDVTPEAVLASVRGEGAALVGLSALMTTTVPAMRETIELLRREAPKVHVVVGGAVLTAELAQMLGADAYGPDAMATVRYAQEVLGQGGA